MESKKTPRQARGIVFLLIRSQEKRWLWVRKIGWEFSFNSKVLYEKIQDNKAQTTCELKKFIMWKILL